MDIKNPLASRLQVCLNSEVGFQLRSQTDRVRFVISLRTVMNIYIHFFLPGNDMFHLDVQLNFSRWSSEFNKSSI